LWEGERGGGEGDEGEGGVGGQMGGGVVNENGREERGGRGTSMAVQAEGKKGLRQVVQETARFSKPGLPMEDETTTKRRRRERIYVTKKGAISKRKGKATV